MSLLALLNYIVSRLSPPAASATTSPTLSLILNRLSSLVNSLLSSLPHVVTNAVAQLFYSTAVSIAFVKYEAGILEKEEDKENWKRAIQFGLQAGVEDLGKQVLKLQ